MDNDYAELTVVSTNNSNNDDNNSNNNCYNKMTL